MKEYNLYNHYNNLSMGNFFWRYGKNKFKYRHKWFMNPLLERRKYLESRKYENV